MPGVYNHMTPTTSVVVGGITYNNGTYFQPLFLYESFLNIITFIIIYGVLAELNEMRAGTIASLYFIDYGIIRFITESLRSSQWSFVGYWVSFIFCLPMNITKVSEIQKHPIHLGIFLMII